METVNHGRKMITIIKRRQCKFLGHVIRKGELEKSLFREKIKVGSQVEDNGLNSSKISDSHARNLSQELCRNFHGRQCHLIWHKKIQVFYRIEAGLSN